jgi:hypothetical protein
MTSSEVEVAEGRTTQRAAAERLGLSYRQMKRLVRRYRQQGPHGIVSSQRGKPQCRAEVGVVFANQPQDVLAEHPRKPMIAVQTDSCRRGRAYC